MATCGYRAAQLKTNIFFLRKIEKTFTKHIKNIPQNHSSYKVQFRILKSHKLHLEFLIWPCKHHINLISNFKTYRNIFTSTGVQTLKLVLLLVSTEYIAFAQSSLHHYCYQNHPCYPSWE